MATMTFRFVVWVVKSPFFMNITFLKLDSSLYYHFHTSFIIALHKNRRIFHKNEITQPLSVIFQDGDIFPRKQNADPHAQLKI